MDSVTENNVAIVVGCIPIVAKFIKIHFTNLSFIQTLRSRLLGNSGKSESTPIPTREASADGDPRRLHTWVHPQANEYYELTESRLQTQVTTMSREGLGTEDAGGADRSGISIVRTVSITQQTHSGSRSCSEERLVWIFSTIQCYVKWPIRQGSWKVLLKD